MLIRSADPRADAAACAAIYAPYVTDGVASLEEVAPTGLQMRARIERLAGRWPWLVAELEGQPAGFAYAGPHNDRAAYRWSVSTTVYVDGRRHRLGIGRALYDALLELLRAQGFYAATAGISLPNPASVGLHEALGFRPVGVYRAVGFKHGAWHDVGWWQLDLAPRPSGRPPAEPRPPAGA